MGNKLIIGSSGQIGVELIEQLSKLHGADKIIASDIKPATKNIIEGVTYLTLDVLDKEKLLDTVKKYNISEVYLLAAMLSAVAEKNIQFAWDLNMKGLFHVLDLAKENYIKKIFWPSSIAVFGPTSPKIGTPQTTILEPSTVYGISKMSGERWCEYYFLKYGVDVRSLRYPGIISYKSPPGGGTTDYAIEIFHSVINKNSYDCFIEEDVQLPMIYMDDAIRATLELMNCDRKKLSINSSYNLSGISFSPKEIALAIKKIHTDFSITYNPDFRNNIALSWPSSIDDSIARKDWLWSHEFNLEKTVEKMLFGITTL
ncbi:MAG: NAD-dependent epimerase/dehydratase family protein [Flavobacteriales bacterium]|jgi:nucleoside-diphosphate-sugar epimerase|nr:NAD-dependent epimerase/dehydratase family protein [Flavobacteriales bacterium]MDG1439337.1 NAD-dependent epimerase/dehydratase family protein [Flavobacteriales bacterium]MDG1797741.1 NAD-dependent epimerase/dehydratase family protein [Flavobacteriales bacterium]